ncbi:MAG: DUF72 domain-containing protein [Saprospiraceae bacterium]|nr:DUF72 domain-containing protein [Saprospiraceae bacterium]
MQFGKVERLEGIDFTLPELDPDSFLQLDHSGTSKKPSIQVGCNTWNKQQLKDFYPKGIKDELTYYSTQLNAIEFNASFYRIFPPQQFEKWREKTPEHFKFFPKIFQGISHWKRLKNCVRYVEEYTYAVEHLEHKLGTVFIQLNETFTATEANLNTMADFLTYWPSHIPLAMEVRHTDWHNSPDMASAYYELLESYNVSNIITDTAGRRDLLHMRLTSDSAFIRFVGANDPSDYDRVGQWVDRVETLLNAGLRSLNFFVHQHHETESVHISKHFIQALNKRLGLSLQVPSLQISPQQSLF